MDKKLTLEDKIYNILEENILKRLGDNIGNQVDYALGRHKFYDDITKKILEKHSEKIEKTISLGIEKAFNNQDFVLEMEKTLNKKLAENIIQNFNSKVQSIVDTMRAKNPVFNEEIKIAITKILKKYNLDN
jgi:hypothetical protein